MEESATLPPSLEDVMLGPKQGGTEVYFIRHADALPDAAEVVLGHYDEQSLSELGRKQAQALAEGLKGVTFAAIYSAPLGRARQTAAPLAESKGLEVQVEPGLREVGLGPATSQRGGRSDAGGVRRGAESPAARDRRDCDWRGWLGQHSRRGAVGGFARAHHRRQ